MRDHEPELHAVFAPGLEARPKAFGAGGHLRRGSAQQALMRTVLVEPDDIVGELLPHVGEPHRHEQRTEALGFQGADEALYDGDAAVLANCAVAQA